MRLTGAAEIFFKLVEEGMYEHGYVPFGVHDSGEEYTVGFTNPDTGDLVRVSYRETAKAAVK